MIREINCVEISGYKKLNHATAYKWIQKPSKELHGK